jgi:nitric oxide reductase activation protein
MLATQEPRKVLLILTDGEPDCTDDARLAVDEAVNLGIEVLALGIEQLVYPDIFPHFEVVESAQDLPEKMFALLEQVLLEHN